MGPKILKITVNGIKNINEPVVVDFSNQVIKNGLKKIVNVKGIYGTNGTGKTAFITAMDIYKDICIAKNYLLQDTNIIKLDKLINFITKSMFIEVVFSFDNQINRIYKHSLNIEKRNGEYIVSEEIISKLDARSLNDNYIELIHLINGKPNEHIYLDDLKDSLSKNQSFLSVYFDCLIGTKSEKPLKMTDNDLHLKLLILSIIQIETFLLDSDKHSEYFEKMDKIKIQANNDSSIKEEVVDSLFRSIGKNDYLTYIDSLPGSELMLKEQYDEYKSFLEKMTLFIKVFKPSLKSIEPNIKSYREYYIVSKEFVYEDLPGSIDYEFESAGIKNLVSLFGCLMNCAEGGISFIDEMDTNINSVSFNKLIEFFLKYGEGQLCFTSHNMDSLDLLKNVNKGINFFGIDGSIESWTQQGNKSPKNSFENGRIINNPMNIESFDFLRVFGNEE